MTRQKSFKDRVRTRQGKTGESYTAARRQLIEKSEAEARKRRTPKTISGVRKSEKSVLDKTGRTWDEWFKLLDKWGARESKHGDIARWLVEEHKVDGWWAQSITGAYEQDRGIRAPGQMADGTYTVNASKTINVPVDDLFDAFKSKGVRERWLGDYKMRVRTARPGKSITADWEDASTRLTISFISKADDKSQVALAHEKLADARQADELKAFWRERMGLLKKFLEE